MMKRRHFLVGGMLAATTAVAWNASKTEASSRAENTRREPMFRLSCQLRDWVPGKTVPEKLAQIKAWGIEAVEPHGNVVNDPKTFKKQADDAGLKISVICWGASNGELCSGDPEERQRGIDKLKKALEASAVLECNGAIYTPAFNKDQQRINRTHQQIRQAMIDTDANSREVKGGFLKEVGDFVAAMKVNVVLEPLNRKESWFLRQVADAASICRDSQSVGVKTMGDFYHMYYEEPCDTGAFLCGGDLSNTSTSAVGTNAFCRARILRSPSSPVFAA